MVSNLVIISYFEPILNFNDELREVDIVDAVVIIAAGNVRFRMMYLSDDDWNRIDIRTFVSVGSYSVLDKFKTNFKFQICKF